MNQILQDDDMKVPTRYHQIFIHNVFGHFFHDLLEYFSDYLYPRIKWKVISTYDKAVEYINKVRELGREPDMPLKPSLILNPSGDFNYDESGHGSKQPWRFVNLAPGLTTKLYEPIYQDENIKVVPGFQRFKGDVEFLALLSSFYEYTDFRVYLLQMFTGVERYIYPRFFNSFIILPQEVIDYEYTRVDGTKYKIDWEKSGAHKFLVKTLNQNMLVYPCLIHPRLKLSGITEASTRLGGLDKLADWRLTFTVEYEVEIPTFLVLISDYLATGIDLSIRYESCYSKNNLVDMKVPANIHQFSTHWKPQIVGCEDICGEETEDTKTGIHVILPDKAEVTLDRTLIISTRYYYVVTSHDTTADIEITMPEQVSDIKRLLVNTKFGLLPYGDYFRLNEDGTVITVFSTKLSFSEGDIIELYVYKITEES